MVQPPKPGKPNHYLFVIDTNTYARNFEREMCAYVTGQIGDCGFGGAEAALAQQEIPDAVMQLEDLIEQVPDEHGVERPVAIFSNPRYGNNGLGIHALLTDENRAQYSWPAMFSVAIYFHTLPDHELLEVMKERARAIAARGVGFEGHKETIAIEGFRLLEQHTTYKELDV